MGSSTDSGDGGQAAKALHIVHVVLRDGFRGHTVDVMVDDRTVLHLVGITTDRETARAAEIAMYATAGTVRLAVSVTPGNLAAALDVDLIAHPYVAISLVGEATVAFETSPVSFL
jgi:hypothetical protein